VSEADAGAGIIGANPGEAEAVEFTGNRDGIGCGQRGAVVHVNQSAGGTGGGVEENEECDAAQRAGPGYSPSTK